MTSRRMLTVAMVAEARLAGFRWLLEVGRVERCQDRYAYEGCKRHAIAVFSVVVCCMTRGQVGTMLTVGGMVETTRYPHTAKILQFGGRFDSEGVDLARIHIPQLSLWTLW